MGSSRRGDESGGVVILLDAPFFMIETRNLAGKTPFIGPINTCYIHCIVWIYLGLFAGYPELSAGTPFWRRIRCSGSGPCLSCTSWNLNGGRLVILPNEEDRLSDLGYGQKATSLIQSDSLRKVWIDTHKRASGSQFLQGSWPESRHSRNLGHEWSGRLLSPGFPTRDASPLG